jgi:Na+-driven multidrug efflux pump
MIFPRQLISMFNTETDVLKYGSLFIRIISPFYLLSVINQIYSGSLRGAGSAKMPMIIMLLSFVVFRQIYLYIISRLIDNVVPVALGYPAGWLLCSVLIFLYYKRGKWEKNRVIVSESCESEIS